MPTPDKSWNTAQIVYALSEIVTDLANDHQGKVERTADFLDQLSTHHKAVLERIAHLRAELTALEARITDAFGSITALVMDEQVALAGKLVPEAVRPEPEPVDKFKALLGVGGNGSA